MGKETDQETITLPESALLEELEPDQEPLKDPGTGDSTESIKKAPDATGDQQQDNEPAASEGQPVDEQEISFVEMDEQSDSGPEDAAVEIHLEEDEILTKEPLDPDDLVQQESEESAVPLEEDGADSHARDEKDEVSLDEIPPADKPDAVGKLAQNEEETAKDPADSQVVADNENDPADMDDDEAEDGTEAPPAEDPQISPTADENENDFVALDEDEIEDGDDADAEKQQLSVSKKILAAGLIFLMISGIIITTKSSLPGKKEIVETAPGQKGQAGQSLEAAQIQTPKPASPGKYDKYLAKLEEADRLRNDLLEKKEDIYKLKLHYRNGIVELLDQITQEMQKTDISSLAQALENKRIELYLRTIQRRRAYIQELEKPNQWVHNGSEELLFLKRKTLLDLQIADIASGIDLNRHLRYINAAIQKYQPSAANLSVDNQTSKLPPLETIWSQVLKQQVEKVQTPVSPEDEKIIAEICSGESKHIAELATMTARAAKCLSRMNGSDLFLNGLKQLAPDEAKYLSQWQGNWICLNSVKTLSPAVARHLFKWQGSWISLNGLTEFPPELALYLMEWKGSQLELMGLNYHHKKPDHRALKFLALWETRGGKLFVSEGVRKQMARVM